MRLTPCLAAQDLSQIPIAMSTSHKTHLGNVPGHSCPPPPVIIPWRSSFNLGPRSLLSIPGSGSIEGRKGSYAPLSDDGHGTGEFGMRDSDGEFNLAGVGGQFLSVVQREDRQLSLS